MLTLNILGERRGHGRNGGGEWHWGGREQRGPAGFLWVLIDWRRSRRGCHQYRAAHPTHTGPLCTGACFDITPTCCVYKCSLYTYNL